MRLQAAALTHRGRIRNHNEDAAYADAWDRLAVVCDGMGGHAGGHIASQLAVETIVASLSSLRGAAWADEERVVKAVQEAVFAANDRILARARVDATLSDMGTTIVLGAFMPDRVVTAYVGDSRIYRISGREIAQVSEDHSLVAERIRAGLLDPDSEEARLLSNIVTRALGMEQITVDMAVEDLAPGDTYLLCTDGLHDLVREAEMLRIVQGASTLERACVELVELALHRGGHDNVTVALVRALAE
ncbi:MAG: protein phosphatase 2C domain-containing protein [Planctomycetota bacterium]|nr:protein phosphatase 2C domain-containing protein [Planctomycetota bacterium]MCX8040629.1 protein phosphatase 2C domain-containing protein [Planctomycetota bacterium]MDW8372375.1 protein phosphatase 2C domain-containing protein [Planctomycetota bacterium]